MAIFGVPLAQVMQQQQAKYPGCKIPYFLKRGFKYVIRQGLDIEGLFRIAGPKSAIKELKDAINTGADIDFQEKKTDVTALADVMKIFFRELPECLLMFALYSKFLDTLQIPDKAEQVGELRNLISQMPPLNQEVLCELLAFLRHMAINCQTNKMSTDNLGLVWGPNLLWSNPNGSQSNMLDYLAGAGKIRFVVTIMIEEYESLFKVEPELETIAGAYKIGFMQKLVGHSKSVQGLLAFDNHIWSASSSGKIKIHNTTNFACVNEIDTKDTRPYCLGLIQDKVFVGFQNSTKVYNKSFELVSEVSVFAISFLAVDNNTMWVGSEERVKLVSADSLTVEKEIELPKGHFALSMTFVPSNGTVWVGCTYGNVVVINSRTHEIVKQINTSKKNVDALTVYNGERGTVQVWVGTGDGTIYVFNAKTYEVITQLRDANMLSVYHIAAFGSTIWCCSRDSYIRIWDPEKFQRLTVLEDYHSDAVSRVIFHLSNNKWYAWTSSYDKSLCVWSIVLQKK